MEVLSYCSVISCKNSSANNPETNGVTFHKFPTDPSLRLQWIQATGRKHWTPAKNSTICSQHFEEGNIALGKLADDAVPNINVAVVNDVIELDEKDCDDEGEKDCDDEIIILNTDVFDYNPAKDGKYQVFSHEQLVRKLYVLKNSEIQFKRKKRKLNKKLWMTKKKIEVQKKVIADLMEMYDLKTRDIVLLKNEIIKAQKLSTSKAAVKEPEDEILDAHMKFDS